MAKEPLLITPLHALHLELGAKMVPFAGYDMPVQYPSGIIQEHLHTRQQAGLFDVSHMGQISVYGPSATADLEHLLPIDLDSLPLYQQRYTVLTSEQGGIRDDLMVCRLADQSFLLVVNAACKTEDLIYLQAQLNAENRAELLDDKALLALQGPASSAVLAEFAPQVASLKFMQALEVEIAGIACLVTRSGYTGEDGFEMSLAAIDTETLVRALLSNKAVDMVGLGARDSLRLEAGLCLYGHELTDETTPIEAGLDWVIAQSRRSNGKKEGNFPGSAQILQQMTGTLERKRVGLRSQEKSPIRAGTTLQNGAGDSVGLVTSGGYSPVLQSAIAMAYVAIDYIEPGTMLMADVRGKLRPLEVVELPFVAHRYE